MKVMITMKTTISLLFLSLFLLPVQRADADYGSSKLNVIKAVKSKSITGLGLKEAKELVDVAPSVVAEDVSSDEAEAVAAQLEEAGATVETECKGEG